MIKSASFVFFVLVFFMEASGQDNVPIGSWKSHLPLHQGKNVVQSPDKIIVANPGTLITIDKTDLSADFYSKTEGLSDIGINQISYDQGNDQLFVLYSNSNIDVLRNGSVLNIPNIKLNTSISGDKRLNNIYFLNPNQAFISTGFGIVELNPMTLNFGSTTFTGVKVNEVVGFKDYLYAASQDGLYSIQLTISQNLGDFNRWQVLEERNGLPSLYVAHSVTIFGERLYLSTQEEVYVSEEGQNFTKIFEIEPNIARIEFIHGSASGLLIGLREEGQKSQVLLVNSDHEVVQRNVTCSDRVNFVIEDEKERFWYADDFNDIRYTEGLEGACRRLNYNSPYASEVGDLDVSHDRLLVASGGVSESFLYLFSRQGFYTLDQSGWTNFNEVLIPQISDLDLLSVFRIKGHPVDNRIYVGSYWAGLLEYDPDDESYLLYNQLNSSLRGAVGDEARERVTGIDFDEDQNLWVSTFGSREPLHVLTNDGVWQSFKLSGPTGVTDLVIDQSGYVWMPVFGSSGGVYVYDKGESVQSSADDRLRFINRSNSEITSNTVNTIEIDEEGVIWVGTSEGPVIFDCGESVFDGQCRGIRRKVVQDSIVAFLLADQDILDIEVDGADRKWFGTRNGIFVQSSDGEEAIAHFTAANSPLFDDNIRSLAFRGENGEMFIGTDKGLISYRTKTTTGFPAFRKGSVYAFPNPVQPGYSGEVVIRGLIKDSLVKITDINGNLVFETQALGGQVVWNRKNMSGENVDSGVYLVFASESNTFDTPRAFVTKIMILH